MDVLLKRIETELFNGNVIQLENWTSYEQIINEESDLVKEYNPLYVYCAIESSDTASIQFLESWGYRFSEFRFHSWLSLNDFTGSYDRFFPYEVKLIGDDEDRANA